MRFASPCRCTCVGILLQIGCEPSFTLTLDMRTISPIADVSFTADGELVSVVLPDEKHRFERTYVSFETASAQIRETPITLECWAGADSCGQIEFGRLNCETENDREYMGAVVQERVDLVFSPEHSGVSFGECIGEHHTITFVH